MVIRVPERLSGQNYADVPAAVRDLADLYGLRVVVDGSPTLFLQNFSQQSEKR